MCDTIWCMQHHCDINHNPTKKGSNLCLVNQYMMLVMLSSVIYSVSESLAWNHLLTDSHISP